MADRIDAAPAATPAGWPPWQRMLRLWTPAPSPVTLVDPQAPAAPQGDGLRLHSLRVLVVDDNPATRLVLGQMLGCFGIVPAQAADGDEAVALAGSQDFDLILMDLLMPVLDGLSATHQIRRQALAQARPRVSVVACTGLHTDRAELQRHGIDDLLGKPCSPAGLHACLLRWGLLQARLAPR